MEAIQPRYLLRILSGLHGGAEAQLFDGELVLGSDDGCDLILMDPGILASHLKLTVSIHGVAAEALGKGDLPKLNGTPLEGKSDLAPFQVISLGRVHLAVGPVGKEWPGIEIPGTAVSCKESTDDSGSCEHPPGSMEQDEHGNLPESCPGGAAKARPWPVLVAGVFLVLLVAGGSLFALGAHKGVPEAPGQVLAQAGFAGLTVTEDGDGLATIDGYLEKAGDRRTLVTLLRENGIRARIRVHATDKLVASCNDFFSKSGHRIKAGAGGPGQVVLTGTASGKAGVEKILGRIKKDVPGITGFVDRIVYGKGGSSPATDLAGAGFGTTGSEPAQGKVFRPRLSILSVSLGNRPSMVLGDGQRYFEGSRTKAGFWIKKIDSHGILLKKGNQTAIYHIGGE
jgi:hypothetical protein